MPNGLDVIDHRTMAPPFLARFRQQPFPEHGVTLHSWELRVCSPNVAYMSPDAMHSLEHFFLIDLVAAVPEVVAAAQMGCATGFFLHTINLDDWDEMAGHVADQLEAVTTATAVPMADLTHCGNCHNHSLVKAAYVAEWLLQRRHLWNTTTIPQTWNEAP